MTQIKGGRKPQILTLLNQIIKSHLFISLYFKNQKDFSKKFESNINILDNPKSQGRTNNWESRFWRHYIQKKHSSSCRLSQISHLTFWFPVCQWWFPVGIGLFLSKKTTLSTWNNLYKKNSVSFNGMHGGHRSIILDSTVVKRAIGPCNLLQLKQAAEVQVQFKKVSSFWSKNTTRSSFWGHLGSLRGHFRIFVKIKVSFRQIKLDPLIIVVVAWNGKYHTITTPVQMSFWKLLAPAPLHFPVRSCIITRSNKSKLINEIYN